jgi:hypothetical protein
MFHEFLDQFEDGTGYVKRENPKFGLRWLTWPGNTFCAAVAWRNHPPVEGTRATVREAVANLDRVRLAKRDAKEAAVVDRHQRALAHARRRAELDAANARTAHPTEVEPVAIAPASAPASDAELVPAQLRTALPKLDNADSTESEDSPEAPIGADVRVPTTAATVGQWVATWMRMCADGDLVLGPLNDDDQARSHYNLSAKQLRNIRNAAVSGSLRRRAIQLNVPLPAGYIDRPSASRVNGHDVEVRAA